MTDHSTKFVDPNEDRLLKLLDEGEDCISLAIFSRDPSSGEVFYRNGKGMLLTRDAALELGIELIKAGAP